MSSRPSRGAARLAAILDALPDGLVLVNTNGTVVNANTIALEMFETPGTALVGRGLLDLLPAFDSRLIPGSMRRPDSRDPHGRTKPTRMVARRTDGGEFPVEVTSASLEDGREAYDSYGSGVGYSGDELLMLVVRDLSGTLDTEAELARSQRQTEMILRAASEGVVGTDTDGRIVLVNPAAAQILGWRASDLGGKELHALMLHSKADGEPFPYDESPLADTLRSGRKHRVRGQVVWAKDGSPVPVDLTTAPVRDGDQLVGAVMTFADRRPYEQLAERHAAELAALEEKHAAEAAAAAEEHAGEVAAYEERLAEAARRYDALSVRHAQLTAVLDPSLRGPLEELRRELGVLAADPAGQLWPEANQILHHLAAGYARMTTLVDNVLCFQRLDSGEDELRKDAVQLDGVVAAGVDGAVELIGPGRVQFAVHAPPVAAEVDGARLAAALAHLIADVAGVDSTGTSRVAGGGGYVDSTVVVAAAQRGDVVRIEVRGPHGGGDPVHQPIVRGIVRAHGGVLQTHEVPGPGGSAFVLEVPVGSVENGAAGAAAPAAPGKSADSADSPAVAAPGGTVGAPGLAGSDGAAGTGGATGSGAATGSGGAGEAVVGAPSPGPAGDVSGAVPVSAAPQAHVVPGVPAAGTPAAGVPGPGAPAGAVPPAGTPTAGSEAPESPAPGTPGSHAPEPAGAPEAAGAPRPAGASEPSGAPGAAGATEVPVAAALPAQQSGDTAGGGGRRRARRASTDAFLDSPVRAEDPVAAEPTGRRRARRAAEEGTDGAGGQRVPAQAPAQDQPAEAALPEPTGRRRGRPSPAEPAGSGPALAPQAAPAQAPLAPAARTGVPAEGAVVMAGETAQTRPAGLGGTVPPQGVPQGEAPVPVPPQGTGKRARRASAPEGAVAALPPAPAPALAPVPASTPVPPGQGDAPGAVPPESAHPAAHPQPVPPASPVPPAQQAGQPGGRRARRALSGVQDRPEPAAGAAAQGGEARAAFALPPAEADRTPEGQAPPTHRQPPEGDGRHDPVRTPPGADHTPPQPHPLPAAALPAPGNAPAPAVTGTPAGGTRQPDASSSTQGRAFSVRTLGQGVPFAQQLPDTGATTPPGGTPAGGTPAGAAAVPASGSGRRRKLATPPEGDRQPGAAAATPARPAPVPAPGAAHAAPAPHPQPLLGPAPSEGRGRAYEIGAPDEGAAEGPEPLDGPGGAVEVANEPQPQPVDDELPPEPLDNPRRLLVWPAPDVATQQALSERGYRPVIVHSREEVDAQIAAFPAALFVDPLTGPITRTALQSLRQAAVAAEVPVLLAAGLASATREAAYGADPAVLLKALAPRDSEQHPSRVLLIEEHDEIAHALTAALERRGMHVQRAAADTDAVTLAAQLRPNLVVMDLMQVRRRRAGIIDWLRANGQLNRTPLVVYTASGLDEAELPRLASGETVLFLAERATNAEVQQRLVDLLAKIGTN